MIYEFAKEHTLAIPNLSKCATSLMILDGKGGGGGGGEAKAVCPLVSNKDDLANQEQNYTLYLCF